MASYSAQTLINIALTNLGILEQGGTPSVSDSNAVLSLLNMMVQQWHLQDRFIWQIVTTNWSLVAATGTYTIGPSGTFNGPRPTFIEDAYISYVGPGSHLITSKLRLLTAKEYNDIADLSATAELPQGLYNDRASPLSLLSLYPIPRVTVATTLQLLTWAQLGTFAALATTVDLPDGYPEAITNALGVRCLPMFGVAVNPQVAELVSALAKQAEASITTLNMKALGIATPPPPAAEAQ